MTAATGESRHLHGDRHERPHSHSDRRSARLQKHASAKARSAVALVIAVVAAAAVSSCGHSSTGPTSPSGNGPNTTNTPTTVFQGTFASNGGQTATLSLTIQATAGTASVATLRPAASTVAVTGTLDVGGVTVTLVGTYDASTGAVTVMGSGFSFAGIVTGNVLSGTFTSPTGDVGSFSTLNASIGTITPYCATFSGGGGSSGIVSIQVSSSTLSGEYQFTTGSGTLTGQVSGTSFTFTASDGTTGSGTIQNGNMTGTVPGTRGGTFSGSSGACGTLPTPPSTANSTVTPGTWSYTLQAQVPLVGGNSAMSCNATGTGTTSVSSDGTFALSFSVSCNACTMSGNASGVLGTSVSASLSSSESANSPCSSKVVNNQPIFGGPLLPDPTPASGQCKIATSCGFSTGSDVYGANFSLTNP